jgi:hypothetical protein
MTLTVTPEIKISLTFHKELVIRSVNYADLLASTRTYETY